MDEGWTLDGAVDLVTFALIELVARTGSLTSSAAMMGITQQAASARLARMERRLGQRLLRRSASGSDLTAEGAMVLEWVLPTLAAARRAAVSLDAMRRNDGALSVAASQTIAEHLLPGWLQRLRTVAPEVVVHLSSGNSGQVIASVRYGSAALGFIESPTVPSELRSVRIGVDELAVVVAPGHPWAGRVVDAATLAAARLIVREPGSGTRATLETWLSDRGLGLTAPAAELRTSSAIRAAATAGVGPAVLSARAVSDDVALGRLVRIELAESGPRRPLTAMWSPPEPSPAARALLSIAAAEQ